MNKVSAHHFTEASMSDTSKHKVKALKKASRKLNPLPQNKIVPDKKKTYNRPKEKKVRE
jgi:hypothetical protein